MARVLVACSDRNVVSVLAGILARLGHEVVVIRDAMHLIRVLESDADVVAVVASASVGPLTPVDAIKAAKALYPGAVGILVADQVALPSGVDRILAEPVGADQLLAAMSIQ